MASQHSMCHEPWGGKGGGGVDLPVKSVVDCVLSRHELKQQQQSLHCHAERRSVNHLEKRMGVLLYEWLYIFCSDEWERSPHTSNDGAEDACIYFFSLRSQRCQELKCRTSGPGRKG